MACTVVSAFYPIKSKFTEDKYLEWGKTFLKLKSPIVLFTEEHLVEKLKELREDRPIKFITIPFEELEMWAMYKKKWIENHIVDPEKLYHTPELYAIWAEKPFFVEKAINSNYFNTLYFFWCDFGAFRNPNIDNVVLESFPVITYFKDDKILLEGIEDLKESDKIIDNDGLPLAHIWNKVRLVGGLWGGSSKACLRWKNLYENMLEQYFEKGRFAGKDQTVMLSTYLKNPEVATIVKHSASYLDSWFFFEYLLSDLNIPFVINTTYNLTNDLQNKNKTVPIVFITVCGGLGNQLFQIAAAYAYAKRNNGNLKILSKKLSDDGRPLYWDSILSRCKKYLVIEIPNNLEIWKETQEMTYCNIPSLNDNGLYIQGYLQTHKYFSDTDVIKDLKSLFNPSLKTLEFINNKYTYLLKNKERVVVVHARRTDYLRNQDIIDFHGPLTEDYYTNALNEMTQNVNNPIFLLTSDDSEFWIPLIEKNDKLRNNNIYILSEENEIITFGLLQQFHYFIIANSTFSWWAVWMSNNIKKVIAPKNWFGPTGPKNYQDIYIPEWKLI